MKNNSVNFLLYIVSALICVVLIPLFLEAVIKTSINLEILTSPIRRRISLFFCGIEAKIISLFGISNDYDYNNQMHKSYNAITRYLRKNRL